MGTPIRKRIVKATAVFLTVNILLEAFFPSLALALTSGPSQPEVQSFQPIGTTEMVDLFSGDFNYNIPLLDVGGYPINISYNSGVGMDQESSWVGLGWNINPGVINRTMRGIPDDFDGTKGDKIEKEFNIKPNRTFGVNGSVEIEILGLGKNKSKAKTKENSKDKLTSGKLTLGLGITYNNYQGFGFQQSATPGIDVGNSGKGKLNAGLGIRTSSSDGLSISPSVSFSATLSKSDASTFAGHGSASLGASFNSREGLKALTSNLSASASGKYKNKDGESFKGGGGYSNGGSNISLGMPTYFPSLSMPYQNNSVALSVKFGSAFYGFDALYTIGGYYSEQKLTKSNESIAAFGYFNSEKGMEQSKAIHDFNREKDGSFTQNTPRLPLTNYTYDIYAVSGQGVGGMYRPYRGDVGYVYDSYMENSSDSYSLGLDLAGGGLGKFGADIRVIDVITKAGRWVEDNPVVEKQKFAKKTMHDRFEPFYFKQAGEKSVDNDPYFNSIGRSNPVQVELVHQGGFKVGTKELLVGEPGTPSSLSLGTQLKRNERKKRNQDVSFLTIKEAKYYSTQKNLYNGDKVFTGKKHHIGEMTALKPDGSRYIYGIPAYNTLQEEVSFSVGEGRKVGKLDVDNLTGLVTYGNNDNTVNNEHGIDNFYSKTKVGPYAHSYLLTAVLSPDYLDNDGIAGPTKGDMGTYTKFNYTKTIADFGWRMPLGTNKANSNEGLRSINTDDQANYLYGRKEIWYLESIETKNFIAIFETGNRADGLGVKDQNGEIDKENKLKLLKKISLYYKAEYDQLTKDNNPDTHPLPIKTVNFLYDYSLCPGIENNLLKAGGNSTDANGFRNQGGKLTLKRIFFTYEKSQKGRFSPYQFTYSDFNPSYNMKAYDRWGSFKPLGASFRDNADFPYVNQNKDFADQYAAAWNLTKIDLPSGGSIQINYESDDYAYVQDKPAMQMFQVAGISNSPVYSRGNTLYDGNDHNLYLHLDLPTDPSEKVYTTEEFREKFLKGIENLYFKMSVNMDKSGNAFEYVPGYAQIEVAQSGMSSGNRAYIKLKSVSTKEKNRGRQINPITFAALQFCRLYTPQWAFGQTDVTDDGVEQVLRGILNSDFMKNLSETAMGPNYFLMLQGNCKEVELNRSYVRLLHPEKKKLGGGHRVKSLSVKDNSSSMGMGEDTEYGQEFSYVIENKHGETISSGVAAYEPLIGGEENPFKQPIAFESNKQQKLLIPDDRFYVEAPMGESFFPAASVGYSRVTVKNKVPSSVKRHATGKTVHEFYTAKDFPVFVSNTNLQIISRKTPMLVKLLKVSGKDYMNASQGYVIELNDMHGKPKAQWVYPENQPEAISGVEYKYKTGSLFGSKRLNNEVLTIDPKGNVVKNEVGVDPDFVLDMREQETNTKSIGLDGNFETFLAGVFPIAVPMILPSYSKEHTRFRSAVTTKVINRYGILEEVIAHDLGSSVSTKNIAYDSETGEVLLTETKNEFDDLVYNFSYPAHWGYRGMGMAYQNIGVETRLVALEGGKDEAMEKRVGFSTDHPELFEEGDEFYFKLSSLEETVGGFSDEMKKYKFWIIKKTGNELVALGGNPEKGCIYFPLGAANVKVIRSGRKNMQNIAIGSVSSLVSPIKETSPGKYTFDITVGNKILSAGGQEYSDQWNGVYCGCMVKEGGLYNPYYRGTRGNFRPKKSYTFLTSRAYAGTNRREQGTFTTFNPFWIKPAQSDNWTMSSTNWQFVNEVASYDPIGAIEMENVDALGRPSSAQIGFYHTLPVGVSSNARRRDVLITNFEDYNRNSCEESLSEFKSGTIVNDSHTGRKSIKVNKGTDASLDIINCQ